MTRATQITSALAFILTACGAFWVCQSCFGGDGSLPIGRQCDSDDDCEDPGVCIYQRCREQCTIDQDCDPGQLCIAAGRDGVRVCTVPEDWTCGTADNPCPDVWECLPDGRCFEVCIGLDPCTTERVCDGTHCIEADGDADADTDVDSDSDTDADTDSDGDADADVIVPIDISLTPCADICPEGSYCCSSVRNGLSCSLTPECTGGQVFLCSVLTSCPEGERCCLTTGAIECVDASSCPDDRVICEDAADCPTSADTVCCIDDESDNFLTCHYGVGCP